MCFLDRRNFHLITLIAPEYNEACRSFLNHESNVVTGCREQIDAISACGYGIADMIRCERLLAGISGPGVSS